MKTRKILLCISEDVVETLDKNLAGRARSEFIRDAINEKILRDFGEAFSANAKISRGSRVDLRDASPEKMEKMRKQAAKARGSKLK